MPLNPMRSTPANSPAGGDAASGWCKPCRKPFLAVLLLLPVIFSEQGRRAPQGPARILLALLDRNPRIVEETLGSE
jgi:hypothetical protein